ncbi:MAG: class I SAM-dependent RNA methyltransferase [Proteobacteria bacterium]|nr:class I SAM-dependent RNA methyltransferase [Pseudomonadota bacterium]
MIEKLVPGGLGLGRLPEGIVVMVRYVLPGEQVLVRESHRKKQFIFGELAEILAPSPDRIDPPCPLFSRCGGCDLQHTGYDIQLRLKKEMLMDSLQRTAGDTIQQSIDIIDQPVGSPAKFGYRQRIRLHIDDRGQFGFYHPDSHNLVPVTQCLLAHPKLNEVLEQLDGAPGFPELLKLSDSIELLYNPERDDVILFLHFKRKPRPNDRAHARRVQESIQAVSLVVMQVSGHGFFVAQNESCLSSPPLLAQTLPPDIAGASLSLTWEAGGFCQVNLAQNHNLIKLVLTLLGARPHDRVLDLFCGFGNFSLPVAIHGSEVVGLDGQGSAIRSGRRNAREAGITSCSFQKTPILEGVQQMVAAHQTFQTILIDPPRQGAAEIISLLPKLAANKIIYISCNPATLARDLALLHTSGFKLDRLVPIDMFPQTHHLECVALLKPTRDIEN